MRNILLAVSILAITAPVSTQAATCAATYQQCGGIGWTGPKCCVDEGVCVPAGSGDHINKYYSQCVPKNQAPTVDPTATTEPPTPEPTQYTGPMQYKTYDTVKVAEHKQGAYPTPSVDPCNNWKLDDNVCVPRYCSNDNKSDACSMCSGATCISPPPEVAKSGTRWGEQTTVTTNEKWHYSRSTHYGMTSGGACGFGLYSVCTQAGNKESWINQQLEGYNCDAFCKAYPALCQDPKNVTLRGNFAAPTGNYYSQFWPHLDGARDNYLSCGECFEVVRTKPDGTDYQPGEQGYTNPVMLQITDSCPCENNAKWCCGSEYDHCGDVDFKYGCPLPKDSIHLDLGDIAMGRLQGQGASHMEGVIPTRYRRVQCPMPGNVYIWIQANSGPYYMALAFVNAAGVGSIAKVEIMGAGQQKWTAMETNQDFVQQRPQNRYGAWTIPMGSGPFDAPVAVRLTSPNGEQLVNMEAIKSWTPAATALPKFNYVDFGLQFSMDGKH